jgi:hypothetical protein
MEHIELFDKQYCGAQSEEEFHRIMAELGWKRGRDYGSIDTPRKFPCLFTVEPEVSGNGNEYANVSYYEADVRDYITRLQSLF